MRPSTCRSMKALAVAQDGAVLGRSTRPRARRSSRAGWPPGPPRRRPGPPAWASRRGAGRAISSVGDPLRALDGLVLGHDEAHAVHGRGRHADHEGDVGIRGGQHGRVEATLAVAEEADAGGVDVRPTAQVVDGGAAIAGQLVDGRGRVVTAAAADAPVVVAQDGHAGRGQGVGDEREGLERGDRAHATRRGPGRRCRS